MNLGITLKNLQNPKQDTLTRLSENRMLTPLEVKSLQQDKREAAEKARAFFKQQKH